ncbi:hypothetical protein [Streptomyces sp. NPDC048277]|uniref:hypothetical protein n=1 Tax=Streptomyces sp. NPDC048277 TaxID=3155027 RepID=UPI0033E9CF9A
MPARERGARTDDHLAAAKALWARRPADFDGPFTTLRAAHLGVPPVTAGGSATAGTAPASTPRRSPMSGAACVTSPESRTPTA